MKRIKKTAVCVLLVLLLVSGIIGCASTPSTEQAEQSENSEVSEAAASDTDSQTATEPDRKKVGVIIWGTDDPLSSAVKDLLDYAGEALNIEFVFKTGDFDTESQVKAAENFVAAGVDGIMCVPIQDDGIPKIYKVCDDAQVPYVQMFRKVLDPVNAEAMDSAPYFLGYTYENEVAAGKQMLKDLASLGAKNIGCIYAAPGTAVCDDRQVGIEQAFAEGLAEKTAVAVLPLSPSSQGWSDATNNFITTYPEIDGIIMTTGATGGADATLATIEKNNVVGKIKVAMFDAPENPDAAFENDQLHVLATGIYTDPLFSLMILANYMQGTPLSDETIKIDGNYIYITSYQDALDYATYVDADGVYPYTHEEIQQMLKFYNPDFTAEDLQKAASDWTLANVLAKVK